MGIFLHDFLVANVDQWIAVLIEGSANAGMGSLIYYGAIPALNSAFNGTDSV